MFSSVPFLAVIFAVLTTVAFVPPAQVDTPQRHAGDPLASGGMLLAEQHGRIVIIDLLPGTAAAAAGLLEDDVLLAVNAVNLIDLEDLSPAAVVELFAGDIEADIRLIIGRGGQTFGVHLLRTLLNAPPARALPPVAPRVGEPAPSFTATDLRGRHVRLDDLRGQPVLLDFWASWCPPCRDSAITLRRFADQFGERLTIVGVSLDEDQDAFEAFVYNHHLPGYQVHDGGPTGPITTLYGAAAAGIPYSILIGPDGEVLHMGVSLQDKEKEISRLLDPAANDDGR
jgi:peroxiredoxin